MFNKAIRLFFTIRYIKLAQIYYQIWYRIRNHFLSIDWYNEYFNATFYRLSSKADVILYVPNNEYKSKNQFSFIGIRHLFIENIDWNILTHGKLWNYNLQYFNYLLDESIDFTERERLITDFSSDLLSKKIKLEPYPVSLRIINTILFLNRHNIQNHLIDEALQSQIDYLNNNLEKHILANHLLENIFSLYIASFSLQKEQLHAKVIKLLERELTEQILEDGAHYERSPMYHAIILGKLLLCIDIAESNGEKNLFLLNILKNKASKMLGWINAFAFPDGSWALMNDAAENIAPTTTQLNSTAELLNIHWKKSTLAESGYRKINGNNWELIMNVGNITPAYQPGHAHADMLHFCIWYNGKQVVIDPGTSTYNISGQRNWERSTKSHNTISIDHFNQSDIWSGFRIGKRAKCNLLNADSNSIIASHSGYANLGFMHTRSFKKVNNQLELFDQVTSSKKSKIEICGNILLSDGLQIDMGNKTAMIGSSEIGNIELFASVELQLMESTFATKFNDLKPAKALNYIINDSVHITFSFS